MSGKYEFNSLKKEASSVNYICSECGYDIRKDSNIKFVPTYFPNNGSVFEWCRFSGWVKDSHLAFYSKNGLNLESHTHEKFFKIPLIEFARSIGANF